MANALRTENVIRIDTTAQVDGILDIDYIKVVGGTVTVNANTSAGELIYQGVAGDKDPVTLRTNGMYVTVGGGAVVYFYLRTEKRG